jgi:4-hydroxy-tetrahydrodipicolinate reductase
MKVAIIGAKGKMGILADEALSAMSSVKEIIRVYSGDDLNHVLESTKPDIAIELTSHLSVERNAWSILNNGVKPLIGASGLTKAQIEALVRSCAERNLGGLVVPNFSLGVAYMTKMTALMSRHFKDISIVEFHHAQKKDKPSGTASYTANLVGIAPETIASIRSPGFLAKQQVYINTEHERLIIDHESFSRQSFAQGIQLSVEALSKLSHMVVGLENILE